MNTEAKEVRRRRVISLRFKLRILDRIKRGERPAHVAKSLGLNESTVRSICVNEKKIRTSIGLGCPVFACHAGRSRPKILEKMEIELNKWITNCLESEPPDTISIKQKALSIYSALKENGEVPTTPDFAASTGWFDRFRKRFFIKSTKIKEEISSDHETACYPEEILGISAYKKNRKKKQKNAFNFDDLTVKSRTKSSKNEASSLFNNNNFGNIELVNMEEVSNESYKTLNSSYFVDIQHLSEGPQLSENTFGTNQINVEFQPFTVKSIRKGLDLAKQLELYFLNEDPCSERSMKFIAELHRCVAPYTKIYNHLTQLKITDFFPKYEK